MWILSIIVKKCVVMVCNNSKVEEVNFKVRSGQQELLRVGQYTYLGVEFSKGCCVWDVHMKRVAKKGKVRVGKLHPISVYRNL